jgi:hypothetical protein
MKRKIFFLMVIILCSEVVSAQKDYVKDIIDVANAGFSKYLEKIPQGQESLYGFRSRGEFAIAKVGKPYHIFLLRKEFFTDPVGSNDNYLIPTDEWRIPLTVENEFRVLITVAKMNGTWTVVGIGAAGLAGELGEFEKKNPSSDQSGTILRILQLDCEFLLIPSNQVNTDYSAYYLGSSSIVFNQPSDFQTSFPLRTVLMSVKDKFENK